MMKQPTQPNGFTLIEMLLVIAVMSVIASLGIVAYRSHLESVRIDRVALEMQNVMQGAMSYNVSHGGDWPDANATLPNCQASGEAETFAGNYLPNGSYQTDYGNNLCWSKISDSSDSHLFWVAFPVPNNDVQLAKRIAAKLPNAITTSTPNAAPPIFPSPCTDSDCYVRAEVTVPGQAIEGSHMAGTGACIPPQLNNNRNVTPGSVRGMQCTYLGYDNKTKAGDPIKYSVTFRCPAGLTAGLVSMPNYLRVGYSTKFTQVLLDMRATSQPCSSAGTTVTCPLWIYADRANGQSVTAGDPGTIYQGYVGADYIAYCQSE